MLKKSSKQTITKIKLAKSPSPSSANHSATFWLENLSCANCAAKIEKKISKIPGIEQASLIFTTKQLKISAATPAQYLDQIQTICSTIEADVIVHTTAITANSAPLLSLRVRHDRKLQAMLGGTLLFLAALLPAWPESLLLPSFILAYVILGGRIVVTAGKNLIRGHIFDENFLMSIATLGAFAIQEYPEAVGVMLFYRIGEYFEQRAVAKSRRQIMSAVDLRPETVRLISGDQETSIPAAAAQIGDLLRVRPGDRIPLDGIIIAGESRIDTSPVTGEAIPVKVSCGSAVISGCLNIAGVLTLKVEKRLEDSMVTRILHAVENAAASKPKLDRFITRFARIYTPIVVAIAIGTAIIPALFTGNFDYWIYTALTFLVISCPCALVLSVPLAFFSGIGAGSKQGILFKGGAALEAMQNIKTVVMDKTGTITQGNFCVQKIIAADYSTEQLLGLAAACELSSSHPIGVSIVAAATEKNLSIPRPFSVEEIAGKGIIAIFPEGEIRCGNRNFMEESAIVIPATAETTEFGTVVLIAINAKLAGQILIADTIKDDAISAISSLHSAGINTIMLTGDNQASAAAVAKLTGITEFYAKLLPEAKLAKLQAIRLKYGKVMFVGDGINDAPVLAGADIGAAMGSGADAAIEAADAVFMTSKLQALPTALQIARRTNQIAWQNVTVALGIKLLVMALGLSGHASMWMAVFADTGVSILCVLNSIRILYKN